MGKKRTHRVRGASLSPRGTGPDDAGTADAASEAGTVAATPVKAGEEPGHLAGEETPLQAPRTPDEGAEAAGLSPRALSRGSTLPAVTVCLAASFIAAQA